MISIKGKKLLILGGTTLMIHVVEQARRMGVYTIVTDMSPISPAKKYADKSFDISTGDMESLEKMAREQQIDGVFTGYDDFNTSVAVELCKRLSLPFYATEEQIEITKHKNQFKNLCRAFDVPVVKEYTKETVEFPCVVKPVDSYSAKGITICNNQDELTKGIEFALQFSKSKTYIIEKYMDPAHTDCVNIDYVIVDGRIVLSAVGDKKVVNQANRAPLTSAVFYPSKHVDAYIRSVDENVKRMFAHLNMKNGTVFIESFFDRDGFAIYEMGYRVGGGQSSILLDRLCQVDYVKMLIRYALSGCMTEQNMLPQIDVRFAKYSVGLVLLAKPGSVERICGIEDVREMDGVVNITQYLHEGDCVPDHLLGTLGQTFVRIHIIADTAESLNEKIRCIQDTLHVYDVNGNDLIVKKNVKY
ncbi:MAG: ATP-grasp domain-containing protein [Clostridia bacterium]|nr:ATP-grasp domain-containing protein [Clostridia bacterium]